MSTPYGVPFLFVDPKKANFFAFVGESKGGAMSDG